MKKYLIIAIFCSLISTNVVKAIEDKYYSEQKWLSEIGWSPSITRISKGANVTVAVIDEGVWQEHPDLQGKMWVNVKEIPQNNIDDDVNGYIDDYYGWNFVDGNSDMTTKGTHGTNIAGIIAAEHNQIGIAGIAPDSRIMSLIACNKNGCTDDSVRKAIRYATDNGANVINLSLGGRGYLGFTLSYSTEIKYAYDKGVIIVASAGNGDVESLGQVGQNLDYMKVSPVNNDVEGINMVVGVGANYGGSPISWSNYGSGVDIWAPGSKILTTSVPIYTKGYGYSEVSGTSFSSPMVAGAAALVKSAYPNLKNWEIIDYLQTNTNLNIEKIFTTSRPECRISSLQKKISLGESFILKGIHITNSFKPILKINTDQSVNKINLSQNFKILDSSNVEVNTKGLNIPTGIYTIGDDNSVMGCVINYNSIEIINNNVVKVPFLEVKVPEPLKINIEKKDVKFVVSKVNTNIRELPKTNGKIISFTKKNGKYEIVDLSNLLWVKIKYGNGKEGWVVKKNMKL